MRITIVQGPYYPVPPLLGTGNEKVWFGLGAEFARRGHEVVHLSRRFGSLPTEETIAGVRHRRLPSWDAPKSPWLYRALDAVYAWRARRALPAGADIVVTHCIWLPLLIRDRRFGALYVHAARFPKGQMRLLYGHAARIQAVSAAVGRAIARELGPARAARVKVIPPYLTSAPEPGEECRSASAREKEILYVGRIHPEKGVHVLVEAFARLGDPAWRLVLVGSHEPRNGGGGEDYRAALQERSAVGGGRVTFAGLLPQAELDRRCGAAALLVYPSLAEKGESFGMVPLEAMARGCVPIVSNLECFRDYLEPEANGLVFDHRSADPATELAAVLRRALADGGLRERLALRGPVTAEEFRLEKVAGRYLDDFAALLPAGASR